ncbi:hypothetical protein ACIA8O_38130 [Kitasatospora sp. NPDC051853]|uniref:hypothetical protein n=1 Tax=Kitasatospora sp. NPDC051853 TaxID=3364058 RepID=UPI003799A471
MTTEQSTAPNVPDRGFTFEVPVHFHDLAMHLDEAARWAHLEELACEIWSGGTADQRSGVQQLYADIAEAAAQDGAIYAGVAMFATEDDRISSASLIARTDPIEAGDLETIVATLEETLSLNPSNDVQRVEVEAGPAVVSFSAVEWQIGPADAPERPEPIVLARVDAYVPLPDLGTLLVLALSTPSLPELPDYVALLSQTAETVRRLDEEPVAATVPGQPAGETAARMTAAFG